MPIYRDLINEAKKNYMMPIKGGKDFELSWCPECDEINLWTYWQGINNLHPKVMVIGQDFGCPYVDNKDLKPVYKDIVSDKALASEKYIESIKNPKLGNAFETDRMLRLLLSSVDSELDPFIPDNKNLFFTNVCLGYRDHGSSNGSIWAAPLKNDAAITIDLIKEFSPQMVICLGLSTFNAILKAAGRKKVTGVNKLLDTDKGCCEDLLGTHIICQAHPGAIGKMNRKKYSALSFDEADDLLLRDWENIKQYWSRIK